MQRHRFYAPPAQINDAQITLAAAEAHHLARVLRLGIGAQVYAFDGCGNEYRCEIARLDKHAATLAISETLTDTVESPLRLTLAQALIKGDKFDWVVQKATELGVARIVPLITEHSEIKRAEEHAEHKSQRWRRIALEAVKQCGRRRLVEIAEPLPLPQFCAAAASELKLIFSERGGQRLQALPAAAASISVAIAAEGGWSEAELAAASQHGFAPVHLGARVLRTETAAITGVALLQHLYGDL